MKTVLAFLLLASAAVASVVTFSMRYTLTDEVQYPNGAIPGVVYYKYDTETKSNSRVRYDHQFSGGMVFSEIENYEVNRLFKICPGQCESEQMKNTPQQWWFQNGDTKTARHDNNFYQYIRSPGEYGLTELWLSDENAPGAAANLKKVVFTTGRTLSFDVSTYTKTVDASKFDENAGQNCSEKSCRTYLDIVFVLDSSTSVDSEEWEKQRKFVVNVTKHFEIGRNSVAVGAVAFGGNENGYCNCPPGYCDTIVEEFYADSCPSELTGIKRNPNKKVKCQIKRCNADVKSGGPGSTCYGTTQVRGEYHGAESLLSATPKIRDSYIVGAPVKNYHVFFDMTYRSNISSEPFYNKDFTMHTCQGWGLEEAYKMLTESSRNPRLSDGITPPKKMVIVMTDGVDFCRNRTRAAAQALKNLGAFVIEVGIGLYYNYDIKFLEELSSDLGGGNPATFSVDDFDGLSKIVDNLGLVTCQTEYGQSGSCSPECHGYCACGGECYCPDCSGTNDICHNVTCTVDKNHVTSSGCIVKDKDCPTDDWCKVPACSVGNGCFTKQRSCAEYHNVTLFSCQSESCTSIGADSGRCEIINNDDRCSLPYIPCHKAVCDPSNASHDENGCVYRYMCKEDDAEYIPPSGTEPAKGCMIYSCDQINNKCNDPIDICQESGYGYTDKCNTYKCNRTTGRCDLIKEKECDVGPCEVVVGCDGATGVCRTKPKDEEYCKALFIEAVNNGTITDVKKNEAEKYYSCGVYSCKNQAAAKTTKSDIGNCHFDAGDLKECEKCDANSGNNPNSQTCANNNARNYASDNSTCYLSTCKIRRKNGGKTETYCTEDKITCTPSDACHNAVCDLETRTCNETIRYPESYTEAQKNRKFCQEVVCDRSTGKYELADASSTKCPSDKCTNNKCVNDEGILGHCNPEPVCQDRNCYDTKCNINAWQDKDRCTYTPKVCNATNNCFKATCDPATGKCLEMGKDIDEACPNDDRCVKMVCNVENGTCSAVTILPADSDPCLIYVCDNETGNLTTYAKCDDQDICTDDICTYDGRCINSPRTCEELNMDAYGACFDRACSKARKNGCYRKVNPHSYFDECGNCVRGYSATDSGVSNEELASCKDALKPYVPAAIGAGVVAAIIIACIIAAAAVATAGTLATRELIRRARAANSQGAHDNPLFEEDGQELDNPTFVGSD